MLVHISHEPAVDLGKHLDCRTADTDSRHSASSKAGKAVYQILGLATADTAETEIDCHLCCYQAAEAADFLE